MKHDRSVDEIEAKLAADSSNLELAWKYWNALGDSNGCDVRAGMHVFQAFREAALSSSAGVLAFAQAFRQLFESSGEGPRELDPELMRTVEAAIPQLAASDRKLVDWLLQAVGHRTRS